MSGPDIRLLALDLDGTILKGERGITPRVRASIAAAQMHGAQITIATGRMFQSARRFARDLDVQVPIICYQGALVRHPVSDETLVSTVLPIEPALAVHAFAKSADLHLNAYVDDELYMEAITPEGQFYADTSDVGIHLTEDLRIEIERGTTKLVIVTDEDRVPPVLEALETRVGDRLEVTRSHPRFAETIRPGVDKGTGLRALARAIDVPIEQTMAIGDNLNDLPLVVAARFGVAMGDGDARVRDAADSVTGTYDEDGVATAIEKFVLQAGATA